MNWTAKWIWTAKAATTDYNDTIRATRRFTLAQPAPATLSITADSFYRLVINGRWVADGPCRAWPFRYQYDVIDVSPYLRTGENTIEIVARYYGTGYMHKRPLQPGLLAQLDIAGTTPQVIGTDRQWQVARVESVLRNVPRIALQMEPLEIQDARLADGPAAAATEYFAATDGPWKNLAPRDVAMLTLQPVALKAHLWSRVIRRDWMAFNFSPIRTFHPGLMESDGFTCMGGVAGAMLTAAKSGATRIESYPKGMGPRILVNGDAGKDGVYTLKKGANFVAVIFEPWGHHNKEQGIRFADPAGLTLSNPIDAKRPHVWEIAPLADSSYHENDFRLRDWEDKPRAEVRVRVAAEVAELTTGLPTVAAFRQRLGDRLLPLPATGHSNDDPHWQLEARDVIAGVTPRVDDPAALMAETPALTVIHPNRRGDVELCYDLGEQNVGYYDIELEAAAGTVIDIHGIEYIRPDGVLQHTEWNRNGVRYTCHDGWNRFTSLKRRSGRYLIVTIRQQTAPVRIRSLRLIESTYPVQWRGRFTCSDPLLDKVWEISARTLKLCMEDSFTDCPLYEQTHWVGDARNEALFAQAIFGAEDLSARCIRLAAQSLELYPIITCMAPTSSADCMLPAWAFLWGLQVRDHWRHTGDAAFLKSIWPSVMKNIRGAAKYLTDRGLFSAPFWNMFDWSGTDQGHRTVLHNSLLLVGCIDAALETGAALDRTADLAQLATLRAELAAAINATWDAKRGAYPDSIHADGTVSPSSCVHTHFLAVLFDVVPAKHRARAIANAITPPEGMVRIGSPFAIQYYYEMLEKVGRDELILASIRDNYLPMIQSGATTVWEQFPSGNAFNPLGFPTRSHTHAWSSAPIHFLHRTVLGLYATGIGGTQWEVSPRVDELSWAEGVSVGVKGDIAVRWRREGKCVTIDCAGPADVEIKLRRNPTMKGLTVKFRRVDASSLVFHPPQGETQ